MNKDSTTKKLNRSGHYSNCIYGLFYINSLTFYSSFKINNEKA